jgi:hypothetical protein
VRRYASENSRFFEIALVLVRFNHIASRVVNANHRIPFSAASLPGHFGNPTSAQQRLATMASGYLRVWVTTQSAFMRFQACDRLRESLDWMESCA